jgi:hypothetical protein
MKDEDDKQEMDLAGNLVRVGSKIHFDGDSVVLCGRDKQDGEVTLVCILFNPTFSEYAVPEKEAIDKTDEGDYLDGCYLTQDWDDAVSTLRRIWGEKMSYGRFNIYSGELEVMFICKDNFDSPTIH